MYQKPPAAAKINLNHPQNKGLLASWNFLEGNGSSIVRDAYAGNNLTRNLTNGDWVAGNQYGASGWAWNFNASTANYLLADRSTVYFDHNKKFTASVITRPSTLNLELYPIMMNLVSTVTNQNFVFGWSASGGYVGLWGGLGSAAGYTSNIAITANNWYHFVVTYNGGGYTTGTNYRCYYNGVYAGGVTNSGNGAYSSNTNFIGHNFRPYDGLISDVRLWERELEPWEISRFYSNPYETFIPQRKTILSSLSSESNAFSHISTGSLDLGGQSVTIAQSSTTETATGGLELAGEALINYTANYSNAASGTLEISGESLTSASADFQYVSGGNVVLEGEAIADVDGVGDYQYVPDGLLELGGEVQNRLAISYLTSGTLELTGEVLPNIKFESTPVGNLKLNGNALADIRSFKLTSEGSLQLGGVATASSPQFFYYSSTGGLNIGGSSNVNRTSINSKRRTASSSVVSNTPQLIRTVVQGRVCKWTRKQGAYVPSVTNG